MFWLLSFLCIFFPPTDVSKHSQVQHTALQGECSQTFKFFFKARHYPSFWIGESRYGECGETHLIRLLQVDGSNTQQFATHIVEIEKFENWAWVEQGVKAVRQEPAIEFQTQQNRFVQEEMKMSVEAPKANPALDIQRQTLFANACATVWNENMGEKGIIFPLFKGLRANLKYYYPQGLYYNYKIDKVLLFPASKYLLVFTNNNTFCDTKQTMHGFMLFSIEPE